MKKLLLFLLLFATLSASSQTLQSLQTQLKNAQASLANELRKKNGTPAKYQVVVDKLNAQIQALSKPPVTTPVPMPVTDPSKGTVIVPPVIQPPFNSKSFDGNFQSKSLTAYTFGGMQIGAPCMSFVPDPITGNRTVLKMDVGIDQNWNVTANPRAQLQTPMFLKAGDDAYFGFDFMLPQPMWTYFLTLAEVYGAPYQGTSAFRFTIVESNLVAMANTGTGEEKLWSVPLSINRWYDITYHEILSADASKGLIEAWVDGIKIFSVHRATINKAMAEGPYYQKVSDYSDKNNTYTDKSKKVVLGNRAVYFGRHKVGSSFQEVQ